MRQYMDVHDFPPQDSKMLCVSQAAWTMVCGIFALSIPHYRTTESLRLEKIINFNHQPITIMPTSLSPAPFYCDLRRLWDTNLTPSNPHNRGTLLAINTFILETLKECLHWDGDAVDFVTACAQGSSNLYVHAQAAASHLVAWRGDNLQVSP